MLDNKFLLLFLLGYIDPGNGYTILGGAVWLLSVLLGFLGVFIVFFKRIYRFFKKHVKIIVALILLGLAIRGIFMFNKATQFNKKVIVLGFDALSPEIIESMMEDGKLPNFSRLKKQGSYRHLSTTNPAQSPVAWSGFATGQNPGKNGVFDFITRDPRTYKLDLSISKMNNGKPQSPIKSKCFWEYSSRKKVPTVVITCPVTFPPDKVYGRMLSGMGVPDILGTEGTFTFYTTEALDKNKHIGGKVFQIQRSPLMVMNLFGPRVSEVRGNSWQAKVPFKASFKSKDSILVEYQKNKFELEVGQWSDWKDVVFDFGPFKKAKGILKFYLVELKPQFKLYITPINFDPRSPFFQISYPKNYSRELADAIGIYYTQGMPMDTWALNEGRISQEAFLEQADQIFIEKKKMFNFELDRFKEGVLFCYFESVDIIQHMFWRYLDPENPLYEKDAAQGRYKDIIGQWYKRLDDILGSVLEKINKEDMVIVLSDHGFGAFRRAVHVNSWLKKNGYLVLKNSDTEVGSELLADVDWSKTKAYSLGFGAIYINQKNREGKGIVNPGVETESLKEEIARKLEGWIDEKYGRPIIKKIYKREEIFWGEHAAEAPDLYIGFNIGYRSSWQTAIGGLPDSLIEDNLKKWGGDHLFDPSLVPGVIFLNKKITKDNPSIYCITPTILKIIGYSNDEIKKCDFDGEVLF